MRAIILGAILFISSVAWAVQPGERLADPALEARAREISQQLRCVVCQNQSIDDSDAELAADLRRLVRERLTAGDNDKQVVAYLVARYGDFVRLKPPFDPRTYLLWFAPFVVLAIGAAMVISTLRRQRNLAEAEEVGGDERDDD